MWTYSSVLGLACAIGGVATSAALTVAMRRIAIRVRLIDKPNERSSHTVPTPRGGGVAFVLTSLLMLTLLSAIGEIDATSASALLIPGVLVALIGYLDDRGHVAARWRFLTHVAAAALSLWLVHPPKDLIVFGQSLPLGWLAWPIGGILLVWIINLCNFMDGIDGIAGVEAITVALGGALAWRLASDSSTGIVAVAFAAAVGGFLIFNFPPAKIFMGDSGSGFIGITLGTLAMLAARSDPQLLWCWLILLGCFMVDATTTLLRRVMRGERFYEAHRSHAYQNASRLHRSHRSVTLAVAAINVGWLLPLGLAVATDWLDGAVGLIVAYAPLVWLAYRYKAGDRAAQAA